jgi:hypothetical protein
MLLESPSSPYVVFEGYFSNGNAGQVINTMAAT